jgi:hypothetical protein
MTCIPTDAGPLSPVVMITSVWPGRTMLRETVKLVEWPVAVDPETLAPVGV